MNTLRIVATFDADAPTPLALRERFAEALRDAIHRARVAGRIDIGQTEELIRALPQRGHA